MFGWMNKDRRNAEISSSDAAFMNDVQESLLAQTTPGSRLVLYMIFLVLVVGLTWAYSVSYTHLTLPTIYSV